jgi:tRNA (guanine-N7-)-methyltransferase
VSIESEVGRAPRSYRLRRRSIGATRVPVYERLITELGISATGAVLDPPALFDAPVNRVVLDIGFGYGDALIELATARPADGVIGVEVHTPGVANVLAAVDERELTNVRVVEGDATEFVERLPSSSLDEVRIWFPDPWVKRKQHRRRIVSDAFVDALVDRIRVGGRLHLATDIADYAAHMAAVTEAHPRLRGGVVARPEWRPETSYERRGRASGRTPIDLILTKVDLPS